MNLLIPIEIHYSMLLTLVAFSWLLCDKRELPQLITMYAAFFYLAFVSNELALSYDLEYSAQPLFAVMLSAVLILKAYPMRRRDLDLITGFMVITLFSMVLTFLNVNTFRQLTGDAYIIAQDSYNIYSNYLMILDLFIMAALIYGDTKRFNFIDIGRWIKHRLSLSYYYINIQNLKAVKWAKRAPTFRLRQAQPQKVGS